MSQLRGLYVEQNQLSGPLPASLGSLSQLRRLHVAYNPLSGPLPASLTPCASRTTRPFKPGAQACASGRVPG